MERAKDNGAIRQAENNLIAVISLSLSIIKGKWIKFFNQRHKIDKWTLKTRSNYEPSTIDSSQN